MAVKFIKESPRLSAKFVKESTNEIILVLPTDSMEVYQYFNNEFIDGILKNTYNEKKLLEIGSVRVVIDQLFELKKL